MIRVQREARLVAAATRGEIRALVAMLGAEPHTPLDVAVRSTLDGMGCRAG